MDRTPDEIKKGLECCKLSFSFHECGSRCPYSRERSCGVKLFSDALALIQQLEAELEDMTDRYKIADDCAKKKGEMNEKLYAEIAAVKAERDAAVEDLADHCGSKTLCKKYDDGTCPHEFDCTLYLSTCQDFEWRGVQKEE